MRTDFGESIEPDERVPFLNERGYHFLLDHTKEMILVLNKRGKIVFANARTLTNFGYSKEELVGQSITRFLTKGSISKAFYALAQEFLGRPQPEMEVQVKTKSGEIRTISIAEGSVPIYENGKFIGVMISAADITEPKKAEEGLREGEARFRDLVEKSGIAILIDDREGNLTYFNSRYAEIFGYSVEEMRTRSIWSTVHPDDAEKLRSFHTKRLQGKDVPLRYELRGIRKDGAVVHLEVDVVVLKDGDRPIGTRSYLWDITDRKRAEDALRRRNTQLELVHHIQSEIPMNTDLETVLIRTAETIGRSFGYYKISVNVYHPETEEIEYLTGWNKTGLPLPRGHRQKLGQGLIGKAGLLKQTIVANNVFAEPDYIPYHLAETRAELVIPLLVGDDLVGVLDLQSTEVNAFSKEDVSVLEDIVHYIASVIDGKRKEEALRASEKRFRVLIEHGSDVITLVDASGSILYASPSAERIFGYVSEERLGKNAFDRIHPDDLSNVRSRYAKILERPGTSAVMRMRIQHGDGTWRWLEAIGNNMLAEPSVRAIVVNSRDITERMRAEEALRESETKLKDAQALGRIGNWEFDLDKQKIQWSDQVYRLYERDPAEGPPSVDEEAAYYSPEQAERLRGYARSVIEQGREVEYEVEARLPSGRIAHFDCNMRPVKDQSGRVVRLFGTVQDITERKRMENELLVTSQKLRQALGNIIDVVMITTEMKDPYTAGHQRRVADLARAIATEMGLSKDQIEGIRVAGTIHDIGKIFIPGEILSKPGKLNEYEYSLIKGHAQVGHEILKNINFPWPIAQIIHCHHERLDGSGYPQGLSGQDIPLEARILGVADVVEAMSSYRPYRPARGIAAALEEIAEKSGILYDPAVVDVCLKLFAEKKFNFKDHFA